jgi:hypothetical protein
MMSHTHTQLAAARTNDTMSDKEPKKRKAKAAAEEGAEPAPKKAKSKAKKEEGEAAAPPKPKAAPAAATKPIKPEEQAMADKASMERNAVVVEFLRGEENRYLEEVRAPRPRGDE